MKKSKKNIISPQYVTNEKGEKVSVIIPIKKYLELLEAIEESEDIRIYDEVKSRNEKRVSLDEYLKKRKPAHAAL